MPSIKIRSITALALALTFLLLTHSANAQTTEPSTEPSTQPTDTPPPRDLGVKIVDLSYQQDGNEQMQEFGGNLIINEIAKGSLAEKMGLKVYDCIIRVDSVYVVGVGDVQQMVQQPGLVRVQVLRNKQPITFRETADMESPGN